MYITVTDSFRKERVRAIPHNSKCRYGERGAADAVPQLPERCLSRKAGIVRCCLRNRVRSEKLGVLVGGSPVRCTGQKR